MKLPQNLQVAIYSTAETTKFKLATEYTGPCICHFSQEMLLWDLQANLCYQHRVKTDLWTQV